MKKRTALIIAIFLPFVAIVHGQNTFQKELSIGGSFGMGTSWVSFVPKIQTNSLTGTNIGLTGRWITENHLGIMFEVNYSQQGWDEKFADKSIRYTRRLNFIDIPFLTHVYFGGKRVRFFVNLGPKIGFLLGESTTKENLDMLPAATDERPGRLREQSVQKNFAWGICGGPGLEIRTGIGSFLLEGRYYYALGDLFNNRKGDDFPQSSSQAILGKLTYLIPLR
ncbi:MAG: PorT family protein [Tannerellaceae bacterium]|jgi:hypothetical protein|nr:PorT family protein [Tannerellaceae bacterium]